MLYAYLDETGQETKDWVFIAGFLGTEEAWKRFVPAWRAGLRAKNSLHVAELRFKKTKDKDLLARLGPIPVDCGLEPVMGGVRVSDYEDLLEDDFMRKMSCGYIAALFPLVIQVLKWLPADERLEIIFEEQEVYGWLANFVLQHATRMPFDFMWTSSGIPKLAKWSFVPKGSTSLTEPADYFAYSLLQVYRDGNSRKAQWCMPILKSADKAGAIGALLTRSQARQGISDASRMMREEGFALPGTVEDFRRFRDMTKASTKTSDEYRKFDNTMEQLLKVPHSEIKAKLDAEKAAKTKKRKPKKTSASRDSSDREGA